MFFEPMWNVVQSICSTLLSWRPHILHVAVVSKKDCVVVDTTESFCTLGIEFGPHTHIN